MLTLTKYDEYFMVNAPQTARAVSTAVPLGLPRRLKVASGVSVVKKRLLLSVLVLHGLIVVALLWPRAPSLPEVEPLPITVSLIQNVPNAPMIPTPVEQPRPQPVVQKTKVIQKETVVPLPVKDTPSPIKAVDTPVLPQESLVQPVAEASPPAATSKANASVNENAPTVADTPTPKEEDIEPPTFGVAYLNNPKPEYSRSSRRAGEQGKVLLRVLVSEQGLPESVEISKSCGFERLDNAALEAVKKWRFVPAKRNNVVLSAYVTVPIQFSLD